MHEGNDEKNLNRNVSSCQGCSNTFGGHNVGINAKHVLEWQYEAGTVNAVGSEGQALSK